jgi:hypothetical protein
MTAPVRDMTHFQRFFTRMRVFTTVVWGVSQSFSKHRQMGLLFLQTNQKGTNLLKPYETHNIQDYFNLMTSTISAYRTDEIPSGSLAFSNMIHIVSHNRREYSFGSH